MPDDPITQAVKERLMLLPRLSFREPIVKEILIYVRTMERELNALKQQATKSEKPTP